MTIEQFLLPFRCVGKAVKWLFKVERMSVSGQAVRLTSGPFGL